MLSIRIAFIIPHSSNRISRFLESHFPDFWNRLLLLNPHSFSPLNPFFNSKFTWTEQVIRNDVDGGDEVWRFFPDSWNQEFGSIRNPPLLLDGASPPLLLEGASPPLLLEGASPPLHLEGG